MVPPVVRLFCALFIWIIRIWYGTRTYVCTFIHNYASTWQGRVNLCHVNGAQQDYCDWAGREASQQEHVFLLRLFIIYMSVSKNRGTPKWMVYNGKPYQNGWFGGTTIFGNTHIELCYFKKPDGLQMIHQTEWIFTVVSFRGRIFMACLFFIFPGLHPWKLTCPLKKDYFSREYIFQPLIFRGQPLVFRGVLFRCPLDLPETSRRSLSLGFPAQFFDEPIDHDLLLFLGRFQCQVAWSIFVGVHAIGQRLRQFLCDSKVSIQNTSAKWIPTQNV